MRTTSRSESENHFFNQFSNPRSTLVDFFSHFEAEVESQWYEHRGNDNHSRYTIPGFMNPTFVLESQLQNILHGRFFYQQLEIEDGIHSCASVTRQPVGDFLKFEIEDLKQPCSTFFEVMYRGADQIISCSCKRFEFFGLPCRHIFYVLRISFVTEFPKKYIVRRWRKEAISNTSLSSFRPEEFGENRVDVEAVLRQLRDYVKDYMSKADETQVVAPPPSSRDRFAEMTGMREPCSLTIRNPVRTRTKGCGSHKRFKSACEIAISKAGDKQRGCGFYKGVGHNKRTCKLYLQSIKEKEVTTSSGVS
ncbi:protein FAR1-RELATED SEQUENCE 5-like [Bidens hawaiensis]|uniref:protein FAR1-RELATED SEQUENCE 5-like n=1 Tax=Bidens hawaiensis TaxID=980011 RepID=UPI004049C59B